jgi:hypothetical protein
VIVQDADLEYDPQNFQKLIEPIVRGDADVVYGSRFLGAPHRVLYFWHYVGNKFLSTLSGMFTNLNLSDVWTCHKAFRREVLEQIDLQERRFGFEQEMTSKIAKNGWRVYEVPISYYGRTYAEGKKSPGRTDYGLCIASCVIARGLNGPLTAQTLGNKTIRRLRREKGVPESYEVCAFCRFSSVGQHVRSEVWPDERLDI